LKCSQRKHSPIVNVNSNSNNKNNNIQSSARDYFDCTAVPYHWTETGGAVMLCDMPQQVNVRVISLLTALATAIKEAVIPSVWNYRMR
jgi:hypothetical protein